MLSGAVTGSIGAQAPTKIPIRQVAPTEATSAIRMDSMDGAVVDPAGRLVYRGLLPNWFRNTLSPTTGRRVTEPAPDSFPVVRADFETRTVDTLAIVVMPNGVRRWSGSQPMTIKNVVQPLPTTDDWAMLSDGTVAIVRGNDYHVDWVHPDGTRTSSPKMPFDWRRITDAEKSAGGLLYDVVSRAGAIVERVQLPPMCALAGFAPHSVMYLNCANAANEFYLKRTRVVR